ncbi:MAG: Arf family protein [Thermotogota bacterium]|nr:Arf family protein [Thermotogota bacterium]
MYTVGFVGIDNAGKTTIIDIFSKKRLTKTIPTVGINLEQINFSEIGFDFSVLDMGGQKNFRLLWIDYLNCVDVILYVIDGSDHERLDEAIREFQNMLVLTEVNPVPILILVNKADLSNTLTASEVGEKIASLPELKDREWNIIETSAITTKGLVDMFLWTYSQLSGKQIDFKIDHHVSADKKYYSPCPLLLEESDGNYCLNHDNFTPVKVVALDNLMFSEDKADASEIIDATKEEMINQGRMVCFNSIFVSDDDNLIHCPTDYSPIEVEGVNATKDEYIESHNMMNITGGQKCSDCLYKILFSAIRRRVKSGREVNIDMIDDTVKKS